MSSKYNGLSVTPGTALSVFSLFLYIAGFIRIELKFNDHDQRLMAVEEFLSQMKHGMIETLNTGTDLNLKPLSLKTRSSLHFTFLFALCPIWYFTPTKWIINSGM